MATAAPEGLNVGFGTPFQAQIDFLRAKLALPTERWDDIQRSAHDRAFIVAGAAKADLLADLQASLVDAATTGKGLEAWRREFADVVKKHGWTGWTGEGTKGGEAWRTKVIYQTNMSTSYAAGRYKQMTDPDYLRLRPYWRYLHSDSVMHPRPLHLAWHGLTLLHEDPFWKAHYPPNGWGCQCRVTTVGKKEGLASQRAGLGEPPAGWDKVNSKTGAPVGIDRGFDYTPGATWHPNLDKYPHEVARQIVADNMKDGVFARWHQRIADRTSTALAGPDYASLGKAEQIEKARRDLGGIESYPVAVLPPNAVESMGLQTQVVLVSEYDLVKQQVSRVGQNFDALDYLQAQITLDNPRLVVRENNQMTLWVSDAAGKWYAAVLQQTATGKGVFLKSFRRSSAGDALAQRKKGEVLLDQLAKE